jgi:hypothetical protein
MAWSEQNFKRIIPFLGTNTAVSNTQRYMCMLTNVISSFVPKKLAVLKLISWKHSFKRLSEEYEIAKKKKQALDNLFAAGRISQSTRDSFNDEIVAAIAEIEKQQKDLLAKMQLKVQGLESQIKTLEMLLANYEIQHVVGEIDEEIYQHEMALFSAGLDTAKQELNMIIEATNQLSTPAVAVAAPSLPQETEVAPAAEVPPVETAPIAPPEVEVATEPCPPEPAITLEEAAPIETPPVDTTEVMPAEASEVAEAISQEPVITVEEAAPTPEQPQLETEEAAPVEAAPIENAEAAPVETSEATEDISQEPVITVEEAAPAPEQTPVETEEAAPVETTPAENTEVASVETSEDAEKIAEESAITIEEAVPEQLLAENVDETHTETLETVEEIPEEPVITIEDSVIEQSSDDSEEVLLTDASQLLEEVPQAVEEVVHEANPRNAPHEAHQEIAVETTVEQTECAEETQVTEEAAADDSENQEEET